MQQKHNVVHGTAARVPLSAAAASSVTSKVSSQPKKKPRGGVTALSCAECRRYVGIYINGMERMVPNEIDH